MVVGAMDVDMQKVMRRVPKSNLQKMYDYFVKHITSGKLPVTLNNVVFANDIKIKRNGKIKVIKGVL